MYRPLKSSNSVHLKIRNLTYHVRTWGSATAPGRQRPLVLLHGWMDVSASFQFLVDAMKTERFIIAPDWRGFGLSTDSLSAAPGQWVQDHYMFMDYLADLEFILNRLCPNESIDLIGHSMGGNIAMLYAGIRPSKIERLINLEGFGMPATRAEQAASQIAKWIDHLEKFHSNDVFLKSYANQNAVADRLIKNNPLISLDKALWLAQHWAIQSATGEWNILGAAAHKLPSAHLYRADESREIHRRITAPVLFVKAEQDSLKTWWGERYSQNEFLDRMKVVRDFRLQELPQTSHMLHHDQPQALARLVEDFLNPVNDQG
jgi:pimeloyl-ACP methyl ester carboxylesterase